MSNVAESRGPRIYNLFPLLAGRMPDWTPHIERARGMEFDWLFLNPIQLPGASGSLYSIKDYYQIHPLLVAPNAGTPEQQLQAVIGQTHRLGMEIMMDLVINHTAIDSPLVQEHRDWYEIESDGSVAHPGAWDNGHRVVWKDLATINNQSSPQRESLWQYWRDMVLHYVSLGVDGFRCDAAYQVTPQLWRFLIDEARKKSPGCRFFAETLGTTVDKILPLADAGFDFIFNSSKWWDFTAPWLLEQYKETADAVPSISFPESHDTARLAAEMNGNQDAVRQRYVFAALFSTGVMIPIGFEYGFRRQLHVVNTRPGDWEQPSWDLTGFIRDVNAYKERSRVWNEEGPISLFDTENNGVAALRKSTHDGRQQALLLFNKQPNAPASCRLPGLRDWLGESCDELFASSPTRSETLQGLTLPPSGFRAFAGSSFAES